MKNSTITRGIMFMGAMEVADQLGNYPVWDIRPVLWGLPVFAFILLHEYFIEKECEKK